MFESEFESGIPFSHEYASLGSGRAIIATSHQGKEVNLLVSHMKGIDSCMSFMQFILGTDVSLVDGRELPKGRGRRQLEQMRAHAEKFPSRLQFIRQGMSYHPTLQLFLDHYRSHPIAAKPAAINSPEWRADFNDFIGRLRLAAKKTNLKKLIRNWESKYAKASKRLLLLEKVLFGRYSRIAVIRLDLAYDGSLVDQLSFDRFQRLEESIADDEFFCYLEGRDPSPDIRIEDKMPLDVLTEDRRRFFANLKGKPTLFEHLIGYAWRIEWTPVAGYHLHLVMFFDGSQVQRHQYLAQLIGDYWAADITHGRGRFFNVNRSWKEDDPRCGIGLISWDDHARRKNLRERVLPYLAKKSQKVVVMPYPGWNAFGTSTLRQRPPSNRGRPRTGTRSGSTPDVQWVRRRNFRHPRLASGGADNHIAEVRV